MLLRVLTALTIALWLPACSSDGVYARGDRAADLARFQAKVLELALAERAKAGLGDTLTLNGDLAAAAADHARDMARRHYFNHESPEGDNALERRFKYEPGFQGTLGENIAAQKFAVGAGFDPDSFARMIVAAWMKSPGHRQMLLSPLFAETGIGVAMAKDEVFVTQLFAGPVPGPSASVRR